MPILAERGRAADAWLRKCVRLDLAREAALHLDATCSPALREGAEDVAIKVFADNLRDLLLAAPAGPRCVMGLDPGIRTGVKVAVVDATGKLVDTATVYPHEPRKHWEGSLHTLGQAVREARRQPDRHRQRHRQPRDRQAGGRPDQAHPRAKLQQGRGERSRRLGLFRREFASQEFPDVDVSLRGAVSIARRLQDPLAELVKIDPKSIGVGQYQHDVNQSEAGAHAGCRGRRLRELGGRGPEHRVGRAAVARVGPVRQRGRERGALATPTAPFANRKQLLEVPRLGAKTFEQSAGFLRIRGGDNPLDTSAVHPEAYPVVERIIAQCGREVRPADGRRQLSCADLKPELFADEKFGVPTVRDILGELEKPGRDPRPDFKVARFNDGVEDIEGPASRAWCWKAR